MSDSEDEEQTIASDLVVTKYKMAGDIVNGILRTLVANCTAGTTAGTLCDMGDKAITEETSKVFKKEKEMKKGIAFPTCVSVNNCVCHFSPLRSEADVTIKDGDLVKIDLGVHIDGFAALVAHTLVVGASHDNKVTGRKADAILAAHYAAEAALRTIKPTIQNGVVTDVVQRAAESFECCPCEGMISFQLQQHEIHGEKAIVINPTETQKSEQDKCSFDKHEVYAMDVLVSSGDGKIRELDTRTTVYKKNDIVYQLKMKASRQFFFEVEQRYGLMAFSCRSLDDEIRTKVAVKECVAHDLMKPMPVFYEREGEFVAQFKFTTLLMQNGPLKITGLPFDAALYSSEHSVTDPKLKELLNSSVTSKSKAKKKKKPASAKKPSVAADSGDVEMAPPAST